MNNTGLVLFASYQIGATKGTPIKEVGYLKHIVRL